MPTSLLITLLLLMLALFFKKSKLLFFVQVIWIMIIAGLNTNAADFQNNYNTYLVANNPNKWWQVYSWLATIFKNKMIDYVYFNFFLVCIAMLLIAVTILRETKYPNLVIAAYYIFPFIDNIIQKRGFYAVAILTYALTLLFKEKKKANYIVYFILVFIAFQFHASAIIMFTIPFFMIIPLKIERNIVIIVMIFSNILSGMVSKLATSVLPESLQEKNVLYFSTLASSAGILHTVLWTLWQLSFFVIVYYIYINKKAKNILNYTDDVMLKFNLWGMLLVLLYAYDPVFTRVFRPILILDLIYAANTLEIRERKIHLAIVGIFLISICSFVLFDGMSQWGIDYMVFQIFRNNLLFN